MDTTGYRYLIVICQDNFDGLHSVMVPVEILPSSATTLQIGGGYEPTNFGHYYDCRISKSSFSGRNAYVQGQNRIANTTWKIYAG